MAHDFEGPFECIGENSEIYKSFSVPIKREVIKIDKYGKKSVETISYKTKFIDSMRFMPTSSTKLWIISQRKSIKLNVKIVAALLNMKA